MPESPAQREGRSAAQREAQTVLGVDAAQATNDLDNAVTAWHAAVADPSATIDALLTAFVTMRQASARRGAIITAVVGVTGQSRGDSADYLAPLRFADALDDVIRTRADSAAEAARADVRARITSATDAAAAAA